MMRSISYSRYFSTATPTQTGSTAKPTGTMPLLTARSKPKDPPETSTAHHETTKIAAPVYSLSILTVLTSGPSVSGTCTASQTGRLARTPTATATWASPAAPVAWLARLPLASRRTECPATAAAPPAVAATASSAPAVTRTTATRRQRPCGSRPSGNTPAGWRSGPATLASWPEPPPRPSPAAGARDVPGSR